MSTLNPTSFAIGCADRLEGNAVFRRAPLVWPGLVYAIARAVAKSSGNNRLGDIIARVMTACGQLQADYEITRGETLTNGSFWRALEAAIRAEYSTPRTDSIVTFDLASLAPQGNA